MKGGLRKYLSGFLVLVLVLTGHSMAVARGMPGAAGYAEYCLGETAVMVAVDAQGNPTGESHICPDFTLSLLNALLATPPVVVPVEGRMTRASQTAAETPHVIRILRNTARGPPLLS